jgi:hypothetical protein
MGLVCGMCSSIHVRARHQRLNSLASLASVNGRTVLRNTNRRGPIKHGTSPEQYQVGCSHSALEVPVVRADAGGGDGRNWVCAAERAGWAQALRHNLSMLFLFERR